MTYYNEFDIYPAAWLRNLIDAGHLPDGVVDERSIVDVQPEELAGHDTCHFFAGIGGWPYALRLADWPDLPVWTGSCPCQPFSNAGERKGHLDERHLWPAWFRLIRQCRPPVIFGEQVASKKGLEWLDAVSSDLEGEGYAVGAADLCAASVGAPHIRQRIFFVAHAAGGARRGAGRAGEAGDGRDAARVESSGLRPAGLMGHANDARSQGRGERGDGTNELPAGSPSLAFWACDWLPCRDGKARPVEPGTFPLAHGIPARVGRLRAYGNAIVPQVAAEFVKAFMETQ